MPLRHGLLRAWEHSELAGLRSRPVVAGPPGLPAPVGACPGYYYDLDLPMARTPQLAPMLTPIRRLGRSSWSRAPTSSAIPRRWSTRSRSEEEMRPQVVPALIGAALEEARAGQADFILVQNFTSDKGPAAEELGRRGFTLVAAPPSAVADTASFASFDGYLAAVRAQYRRRAQQALKRSEAPRVEHLTAFAGLADELARLWRSIYHRAKEIKREVLTPEIFRLASERKRRCPGPPKDPSPHHAVRSRRLPSTRPAGPCIGA